MTKTEIQHKLTGIFQDLFDNPTLELSDTTTAKDVQGWDSLSHINLIVATEKAFAVSFTTKEVKGLTDVGGLIGLIAHRAK
jgi:acyl carrier protein